MRRNNRVLFETDLGATFSACERYRYSLWRVWSDKPVAVFCMLNPSTADETEDDQTIRRCQGFARLWDCGGVRVVNLFALRSTDPRGLYKAEDPVGPLNNAAILQAAREGGRFIAAWGVHGLHLGRANEVVRLLVGAGVAVECLGTTKDGHPRHPLYLRADSKPVPLFPPALERGAD